MLNRIFGAARWLVHYWILSTVALFALLMIYTSSPIFGQSPNPTPDIQTVPELVIVPTATNTPFPTATPVDIPQVPDITATPSRQNDKNQDNNGDAGSDSNVGGDNGDAGGATGGGSSSSGGVATGGDAQTGNSSVTDNKTFTQTNDAPTGKALVAVLNMRKSPSTGSAIIDTLFRNDIVQIRARSADGNWWLVCCGADTKGAGWVSAKLIRPNFNLAQANALLPVMGGSSAAPATTKAPAANSTLTATVPMTTSGVITTSSLLTGSKGVTLAFQMRPSPAFVWQGQLVNLQFVIANHSQTPAVNVRLRDDLPAALQYTAAVISHNGQLQQQAKATGSSILSLAWPQLAAGSEVTATITLRVATDLPNGSLIDNLAVVAADNAGDVPAGITLAMPPTVLPLFK